MNSPDVRTILKSSLNKLDLCKKIIYQSKLAPIIDKALEKMNTRSDYEIVCVEEDKIFLVDLDLGNRSVTNDAEEVVYEIKKNFPNRRIIYRDTLNQWDEIILNKNGHAHFTPYNEPLPEFTLTKCPNSELLRT